jgi:hypothetical protein
MMHRLLWAAMIPVTMFLAGCENSATAFMIDGREHALILVREQSLPFSEVNQFILVTRMPHCQRRWRIQPDATPLAPIKVYAAGERLWALEQKGRWYLASTEECQVQVWQTPDPARLMGLVGTFTNQEGQIRFTPAK